MCILAFLQDTEHDDFIRNVHVALAPNTLELKLILLCLEAQRLVPHGDSIGRLS